ncbi:hypothetical protein [Rhizobium paknamense]|uniref:Uncharacterized protein n=1 Tax=Rhizobium paknamense TaxID=1206817 RepID=A0ABU0I6E1_9HYPH|nr:hypothetical protein [Rhizobium paknamense]MDQ0453777.1 hypothetical protein [Rhizobium paknamense]
MQAALIIMTILGCNDSVSQCQYIATAEQRWVSLEMCNGDSEKVLAHFSNVNYPSVVAVCQKQDLAQNATKVPSPATPSKNDPAPEKPMPEAEKRSFAQRAVGYIREVIPGKRDMKLAFEKPLHVVTSTYTWVAKKLDR